MERNYQNVFAAAMIIGAQTPNGASIPLERLLALTSRDGLQRLDDPSIGNLIRLRSEFANSGDTVTCAGIWSGSTGNLVPAIEKLPTDQQRQWADLFNQAALAIMQRVPARPAPAPDQFQPALNRMLTGLPQTDFEAINTAIQRSSPLTPVQECDAARAFYRALTRANPADAIVVARTMMYQ